MSVDLPTLELEIFEPYKITERCQIVWSPVQAAIIASIFITKLRFIHTFLSVLNLCFQRRVCGSCMTKIHLSKNKRISVLKSLMFVKMAKRRPSD